MFSILLRLSLVTKIFIAIILGFVVAFLFPNMTPYFSIFGEIFIKALKAVAPILVFVLVISSIANFNVEQSAKNFKPILFTTIVRNTPKKFDICNRTLEKAKRLTEATPSFHNKEVLSIKEAEERLEQYDVIIHTTSVGMYPNVDDVPLSLQRAASSAVVCDIVYNPIQTALLKEASQKGLKTLDGVGMFVEQAALSFQLWTGQEPNIEKMRSIVIGKLGGTEC